MEIKSRSDDERRAVAKISVACVKVFIQNSAFTTYSTGLLNTPSGSGMVDSRRPHTNIDRVNVQRLLHEARAVVERRAAIQLGGRHPKPLLRIDPHGVDPEETLVAQEDRHGAVWRDFEDVLSVGVADVDVALRVDCGSAWKECFGESSVFVSLFGDEGVCNLPVDGVKAYGSL